MIIEMKKNTLSLICSQIIIHYYLKHITTKSLWTSAAAVNYTILIMKIDNQTVHFSIQVGEL